MHATNFQCRSNGRSNHVHICNFENVHAQKSKTALPPTHAPPCMLPPCTPSHHACSGPTSGVKGRSSSPTHRPHISTNRRSAKTTESTHHPRSPWRCTRSNPAHYKRSSVMQDSIVARLIISSLPRGSASRVVVSNSHMAVGVPQCNDIIYTYIYIYRCSPHLTPLHYHPPHRQAPTQLPR